MNFTQHARNKTFGRIFFFLVYRSNPPPFSFKLPIICKCVISLYLLVLECQTILFVEQLFLFKINNKGSKIQLSKYRHVWSDVVVLYFDINKPKFHHNKILETKNENNKWKIHEIKRKMIIYNALHWRKRDLIKYFLWNWVKNTVFFS